MTGGQRGPTKVMVTGDADGCMIFIFVSSHNNNIMPSAPTTRGLSLGSSLNNNIVVLLYPYTYWCMLRLCLTAMTSSTDLHDYYNHQYINLEKHTTINPGADQNHTTKLLHNNTLMHRRIDYTTIIDHKTIVDHTTIDCFGAARGNISSYT